MSRSWGVHNIIVVIVVRKGRRVFCINVTITKLSINNYVQELHNSISRRSSNEGR